MTGSPGRSVPALDIPRSLIAGGIGSCGRPVAGALGRPCRATLAGALGLGATVILYTGVGQRYDYVGLAASVSAGLALIQIIFMSGLRRFLEFRWREYVGNALIKPAVLAVPLAGVYAAWGAVASLAFGVIGKVDLDVLKTRGHRSS